MNTDKLTTQLNPSIPVISRSRTLSGASSHVRADRREGDQLPADAVKTNLRRPTESHWDWIIDRATD